MHADGTGPACMGNLGEAQFSFSADIMMMNIYTPLIAISITNNVYQFC